MGNNNKAIKHDAPTLHDGSNLIAVLDAHADRMDVGITELSERLGMSRSYLYSLRSGQRPTSAMGRESLQKIAEFLDARLAWVYLAAGVIEPWDFFDNDAKRFANTVNRAFDFIAGDPDWCALCPAPGGMTLRAKTFVVMSYQKANGLQLLPPPLTHAEIENMLEAAESDS